MAKSVLKIIFIFLASISTLAIYCTTDEQKFIAAQNEITKQGFFPAAAIVAATLDVQGHIQVNQDFDPTQINRSLIEQYFMPVARGIFRKASASNPLQVKIVNADNTGFDDGTITKANFENNDITFDIRYQGETTTGSTSTKKLMTESNVSFLDYNQPIFYDTTEFKKQVHGLDTSLSKIIGYMS